MDVINDAIWDTKEDVFLDALSFFHDASHLASSLTTQCKKKLHQKETLNGTPIPGFVVVDGHVPTHGRDASEDHMYGHEVRDKLVN